MYDSHFVPKADTSETDPIVRPGQLVFFGDCAGVFHPGRGAEAVLILPPFGHEALACAKTLRLVAEGLNALGYPVLRLDFPGTGDAPGDESDASILTSRCAGAVAAARWLRKQTGGRDVAVVGVRLGAAIAMLAAGDIAPSRTLLAAPVLRGRGFLRELQQIQSFYASGPAAAHNAAPDEYNGFRLSAESVAALRAMDLRHAAPPQAPVTVLDAPAGAAANLVESWKRAGASADFVAYDGTERLLADPAVAPAETSLAALACGWFGPAAGGEQPAGGGAGFEQLSRNDFRESGQRFGERRSLFGVLCEPVCADPDAPALVIVNTGGNSHVGWGRQTVELARRLAHDGIATLRIDIAGVGESPDAPERGGRIVYEHAAARDVVEAVAHLQTLGYGRPAIAGVCSGAFLTFNALREMPELSGVLMVNLQKFEWRDGDRLVLYNSIGGYVSRLFDAESLKRALRGESDIAGIARTIAMRLGRMLRTRLSRLFAREDREAGADVRPSPRAVIEQACSKGVAVTMAYTEGDGGIDEMRGEIGRGGRLARKARNFEFAMIRGADHNFSTAASRERLYPLVLGFVRKLAASHPAQAH